MLVESLDFRHITPAEALAIGRLLFKVWPKPEKDEVFRQQQILSIGQDYQGPDNQVPRSFVIREGDRVLAHAGVLPRTIGTSHGDLTIAGLCRVCTDPEMRGKKLGEMVVRRVFDLVDDKTFDFSLFQTSPRVSKYYEGLGACVIDNRIINSLGTNPQECPFWDEVRMRYPANREWPTGEIDLRGTGY